MHRRRNSGVAFERTSSYHESSIPFRFVLNSIDRFSYRQRRRLRVSRSRSPLHLTSESAREFLFISNSLRDKLSNRTGSFARVTNLLLISQIVSDPPLSLSLYPLLPGRIFLQFATNFFLWRFEERLRVRLTGNVLSHVLRNGAIFPRLFPFPSRSEHAGDNFIEDRFPRSGNIRSSPLPLARSVGETVEARELAACRTFCTACSSPQKRLRKKRDIYRRASSRYRISRVSARELIVDRTIPQNGRECSFHGNVISLSLSLFHNYERFFTETCLDLISFVK